MRKPIDWSQNAAPQEAPSAGIPCGEDLPPAVAAPVGEMLDLEGWVRAYRRLEMAHRSAQEALGHARALLGYLDPYLPRELQDERARAANEAFYRSVAESVE